VHVNDFVRSYFEAWNQMDPEGVAGHMTSDGIYCDMTEDVQRSRDELVVSLAEFFDQFRQRYELIGDILTGQDTIAFQYRMSPFENQRGPESVAAYHGAEFITMHGDFAISITDYYDVPTSTSLRKYARSGLNNDQMERYKKRLDRMMQTQSLYLRPDLTSPQLAAAVGCTVNHLSQVINAGFGSSFFDYVNRYRIIYAQQLMAQRIGQKNAVLNIAYDVGFNSNSAFYAAFKKFVGETPAQHRRKLEMKS
jgi:AraC-like DNA-binding protein